MELFYAMSKTYFLRLFIMHILLNGAATNGNGMCLRFSFLGEMFFMNRKVPAGTLHYGKFFLRGKPFVRKLAAAT